MNYLITTEIGITNDYSYGRLRATAMFSLEFNPKRGFRSVFQTINPKTRLLNKPKKGTYNMFMLIAEQDSFYRFKAFEFYADEDFNKVIKFLADNYILFTLEQQKYIFGQIISYLRVTSQSQVVYCGSDVDEVLKVIDEPVKKAIEGLKNPNIETLKSISLDYEALNALKVPNYQPFVSTYYK